MKIFPIYITISPQCWFGRHQYSRWKIEEEAGHLKDYGYCKVCAKEKYFK